MRRGEPVWRPNDCTCSICHLRRRTRHMQLSLLVLQGGDRRGSSYTRCMRRVRPRTLLM